MKRAFLLLGLVILSFVSSYADQNITSCGTVITTADNYFLNQSINTSSGTCIEFQAGASGSTLNCQGFSINNTGSANYAIILDASHMYLNNCKISNFAYYLDMDNAGESNYIDNFTFTNISSGVFIDGNNHTIKNSFFNKTDRLFISNSAYNTTLKNNTFIEWSYIENRGSNGFFDSLYFDPIQYNSMILPMLSVGSDAEYNHYSNLIFRKDAEMNLFFDRIRHNTFENISFDNGTFSVNLHYFNSRNNTFKNISGSNFSIREGYNLSFENLNFLNSHLVVSPFGSPTVLDINSNVFINSNLGNLELDYAVNNSFINTSFTNITSFNWSQTPNFFENNSYAQGIVNSSGCIIAAQPEVICDIGTWSVFSPLVTLPSSTASLFPAFGLVNIIILLGGLFLYFM